MSNASAVRFAISVAGRVLPSGSYAQAEYTSDGQTGMHYREKCFDNAHGVYSSGWQGLPTGANGDYLVRIVVYNAGTDAAPLGLHQLHCNSID